MPEEEAFALFVKIMYGYGLRDLFRQNFQALHVKLYQVGASLNEHAYRCQSCLIQLEALFQESFPDLYEHFKSSGVEMHMFASQWFLTLFAAKVGSSDS